MHEWINFCHGRLGFTRYIYLSTFASCICFVNCSFTILWVYSDLASPSLVLHRYYLLVSTSLTTELWTYSASVTPHIFRNALIQPHQFYFCFFFYILGSYIYTLTCGYTGQDGHPDLKWRFEVVSLMFNSLCSPQIIISISVVYFTSQLKAQLRYTCKLV